ncbi:hypothetical protein [Massilia sp. S19_KUP03_FR1]|uniref:hypothetical protein n=1 Tax=Massilia sp. S19_KUP03_FR1 TaxID=3025503 RepID=UPI002FCD87EA
MKLYNALLNFYNLGNDNDMLKKILTGLSLIGLLQGCSTIGVDQMVFTNGMVTSARGGYAFEETPMKKIKQRDSLVVITHAKWEPLTSDAGRHAVNWTWYMDGKVVAIRKQDMKFAKSPFRLFWRLPAGDFDPGHYRVEVSIDEKVVDTLEYDVVI